MRGAGIMPAQSGHRSGAPAPEVNLQELDSLIEDYLQLTDSADSQV